MALFRGIQEYIALDANNIAQVVDEGNIVSISGNIFFYHPQGHPILYTNHPFSTYILKQIIYSSMIGNIRISSFLADFYSLNSYIMLYYKITGMLLTFTGGTLSTVGPISTR